MMSELGNHMYKALTALAIEKTLIDFGTPTYDKVIHKLRKEYNCNLTDCYEYPEYLSVILKELFGNSNVVIITSITKQLEEFSHKEKISRFLKVISH